MLKKNIEFFQFQLVGTYLLIIYSRVKVIYHFHPTHQ